MNGRLILIIAIPAAILLLAPASGADEEHDLRISPPENSSTTYNMTFSSSINMDVDLEDKPLEISGNTSINTMFTFVRSGERDNQLSEMP